MARSINYKGTLQKYGKSHFFDLRFEENATELLSKLLSDINNELVTNMEKLYKAEPKIYNNMFHRCAKKATEKVLVGSTKDLALSEALRQLALHESGCMIFGDASSAGTLPKRRLTHKEEEALAEYRRTQKFIGRFRSGVMKFSSKALPSFILDKSAGNTLALRIYSFAEIVAEAAASSYAKNEELKFIDIKNVVAKYLGKDALKAANGEGSKWLLLYENGLLDFKARREIQSQWSKSDLAKTKIYTSVFLPSVKRQLKEASEDSGIDPKTPKFLGHTLMDVAGYLAQTAAEVCQKRKAIEMGQDNLNESISLALPGQLRQHALLKANNDVRQYNAGFFVYDRKPIEEKGSKSKKKVKNTKRPVKRTQTPGRKGNKTQQKRKRTKSRERGPATKRQRPVSQPIRKKPGSINFSPPVIDLVSAVFENADITLARDTKTNLCNLLDDACEALASHSVSAADPKELGVKEIKSSVCEVFPGILQELADAYGSHVLDCWNNRGNAKQNNA